MKAITVLMSLIFCMAMNLWAQEPSGGNCSKKVETQTASEEEKLNELLPARGSRQEQDIAQAVIDKMVHGETLEEVFGDPFLKKYTKQDSYLYTFLCRLHEYKHCSVSVDYLLAPATEQARRDWRRIMEGNK